MSPTTRAVVDDGDLSFLAHILRHIPLYSRHRFGVLARGSLLDFSIHQQTDVTLSQMITATNQERNIRFWNRKREGSQCPCGSIALISAFFLSAPALILFKSPDPPITLVVGRLAAAARSRVVAEGRLVVECSAGLGPTLQVALLKVPRDLTKVLIKESLLKKWRSC